MRNQWDLCEKSQEKKGSLANGRGGGNGLKRKKMSRRFESKGGTKNSVKKGGGTKRGRKGKNRTRSLSGRKDVAKKEKKRTPRGGGPTKKRRWGGRKRGLERGGTIAHSRAKEGGSKKKKWKGAEVKQILEKKEETGFAI